MQTILQPWLQAFRQRLCFVASLARREYCPESFRENCCQAGGQRDAPGRSRTLVPALLEKPRPSRATRSPRAFRGTAYRSRHRRHLPTQLDAVLNRVFSTFRVRHEEDDVSSLTANLAPYYPT